MSQSKHILRKKCLSYVIQEPAEYLFGSEQNMQKIQIKP